MESCIYSLCGQCSCYTRVQTATVEAVSGMGGIKAIDSLDHLATAYHTAKERLERKFGGQHRQIAFCIWKKWTTSSLLIQAVTKILLKFADLLDVTLLT